MKKSCDRKERDQEQQDAEREPSRFNYWHPERSQALCQHDLSMLQINFVFLLPAFVGCHPSGLAR